MSDTVYCDEGLVDLLLQLLPSFQLWSELVYLYISRYVSPIFGVFITQGFK